MANSNNDNKQQQENKEHVNEINKTENYIDSNRILMSDLHDEFNENVSENNYINPHSNDNNEYENNGATISHLPQQQYATKISIEKRRPFDSIWLYLGFSDDEKDRKFTVRKIGTFISKFNYIYSYLNIRFNEIYIHLISF